VAPPSSKRPNQRSIDERLPPLTEVAIELFITEEDARPALEDCLRDEPRWRGLLEVSEVELDHEHTSLN
jgi:hypothetical protein